MVQLTGDYINALHKDALFLSDLYAEKRPELSFFGDAAILAQLRTFLCVSAAAGLGDWSCCY